MELILQHLPVGDRRNVRKPVLRPVVCVPRQRVHHLMRKVLNICRNRAAMSRVAKSRPLLFRQASARIRSTPKCTLVQTPNSLVTSQRNKPRLNTGFSTPRFGLWRHCDLRYSVHARGPASSRGAYLLSAEVQLDNQCVCLLGFRLADVRFG